MDLTDIHAEMKNDCGDAQERIAMEAELTYERYEGGQVELDPLRNPLPEGSNAWEQDFMKTMRKAQKYGWKLSDKQIQTLNRIRANEEDYEDNDVCPDCEFEGGTCRWCYEDEIDREIAEREAAYSHMTEEQRNAFNEYMSEVSHRDVQSGSYGNVGRFHGPCPTWYDSSGYSNGRGYQVYVE